MKSRLVVVLAGLVVGCVIVVGMMLVKRIDASGDDDTRLRIATSTTATSWPAEPIATLPTGFDPAHVDELVHPRTSVKAKARLVESSWRGHACGGDLPPCSVMRRESGGDIHAYNPTGCSGHGCYGKWQCDPTTCDGTGTEAEQDAEARRVWDHGRGCAHWDAC